MFSLIVFSKKLFAIYVLSSNGCQRSLQPWIPETFMANFLRESENEKFCRFCLVINLLQSQLRMWKTQICYSFSEYIGSNKIWQTSKPRFSWLRKIKKFSRRFCFGEFFHLNSKRILKQGFQTFCNAWYLSPPIFSQNVFMPESCFVWEATTCNRCFQVVSIVP